MKIRRIATTTKLLSIFVIAAFSTVITAKEQAFDISEAGFGNPTLIDNPYWPLVSGSSHIYFAETEDGCEYNKVTVTSDSYDITYSQTTYNTLIVRDQEWLSEDCDISTAELMEDTWDYYAQDNDGNVWYFGEHTWAVDEDSEICSDDGAWIAGADADPGIVMMAEPTQGDRYNQEFAEEIAEDRGAVLRLNARISIDNDYYSGEFENCLMTREWTPLEPGEIEHKFYCPSESGPGLVFIEELKGKTVYVEYIGSSFDVMGDHPPGEFDAFPALDACDMP